MHADLQQKKALIQQNEKQLERHINRIQQLTTQLREKDDRFRQREEELLLKNTQLQEKIEELQQRNTDNSRLQREIKILKVIYNIVGRVLIVRI